MVESTYKGYVEIEDIDGWQEVEVEVGFIWIPLTDATFDNPAEGGELEWWFAKDYPAEIEQAFEDCISFHEAEMIEQEKSEAEEAKYFSAISALY